jgi:NitT/TauT family transport system substrate-binding protein
MNVLEASLPLWEAETPGLTETASWEQTEMVLLEMGLIDQPLEDLEATHTNRFVLSFEGQ